MMPVQKGKEVILLKKLIRKYGHVWMLSYAFIYIPWFTRLQENINKPYHVMHTALDDMIPFEEIFIVPYLMWFLYVAATIAFFFFRNRDDYYRLCTFLFTGMTISLLVCTLFPNGTDFRPAIDPDKNIFCYLVSRLWSIDPCINVFPSIHVYNSVGVHIAVCHSEELKKHPMIVRASGILMVLICLATMFLKQHSVIDVVGALLMASVIYPIAYAPEAEKKKVRDELLNIITSNLCRTVFTTVLFFAVFSNFYIHRSPSPPAFFECATAKTAVLFTCHISMQKNSCLYFLSYCHFLYPVVKSTTFRYGVPFAQAARFSPAIRMIRSNVSGRKKFPAT
mgnify:CR=1 FL=1